MGEKKKLSAQQPRARRTRQKMLDALERLLRLKSFDQIAVADIAAEAGVSVGSVYAHFEDKTAFLEALLEQRVASLHRRLSEEEPIPGIDPAACYPCLALALRAAVGSALAQAEADAHITRALATLTERAPEAASRSHASLADKAYARTMDFLAPYEEEIVGVDLASAARMVNWFLNSAFYHRAVSAAPLFPPRLVPSDAELVEGLAEMLRGWLTGSARADKTN